MIGTAAKNDLAQAIDWYAEHSPGLEQRFVFDFEQLFQQLETFPESHPIVHRDVRRAHLKSFPYAVLYYQRPNGWFMLGVIHQARDPNVWKHRRQNVS